MANKTYLPTYRNRTDQVTFHCTACNLRSFTTYRGLNQHLRSCLKKSRDAASSIPASQPCPSNLRVTNIGANTVNEVRRFLWGERNGNEVVKLIEDAYEKIVFWKKNIFMLPTGATGKKYTIQLTKFMEGWVNDSPLKDVAFKAIHVMPSLLCKNQAKRRNQNIIPMHFSDVLNYGLKVTLKSLFLKQQQYKTDSTTSIHQNL